MPKFIRDEFFEGGKFLKVDDVKDGQIFTIEVFEKITSRIGDRPLIRFKNVEQPFGLNATNADKLVELFGDDTDDWEGKKIKLIKVRARNPQLGKEVDALRIQSATKKG